MQSHCILGTSSLSAASFPPCQEQSPRLLQVAIRLRDEQKEYLLDNRRKMQQATEKLLMERALLQQRLQVGRNPGLHLILDLMHLAPSASALRRSWKSTRPPQTKPTRSGRTSHGCRSARQSATTLTRSILPSVGAAVVFSVKKRALILAFLPILVPYHARAQLIDGYFLTQVLCPTVARPLCESFSAASACA